MLAESPSPPLSRTGSTTLPLCSKLLSPGPQPFWREEKVAAFSLPLSLRGIALERLRLLCCSSREGTLCSSHFGDNMFAEKKIWCETTFFHLDFFFAFYFSQFFFIFIFYNNFCAPCTQLQNLSSLCCALSLMLCPFLQKTCALVLVTGPFPLSLLSNIFSHLSIWFYATKFKTKGYVQILAALRRDRAAAKDPAEIQKSQAEWSTKKKKKRKHHPFLCLSQIPLSL